MAKTLQEIEARLAEIKSEVETRSAEITSEETSKFNSEFDALSSEKCTLIDAEEKRQAFLDKIANSGQGSVITKRSFLPTTQKTDDEVGVFDSTEYRKAFMKYVLRGVAIPTEYRAAGTTLTTDVGAVIPTTIVQQIFSKLESVGSVLAVVTKTNYKGGASLPIATLKPTADWLAEGTGSTDEKLATATIAFAAYKLGCSIAVSLEVDTMSISAFETWIVGAISEAMIKALEFSIISGDGNGKPTGILTTTPPDGQVITIPDTGIDYATLLAVEGAIPTAYENHAKWFMSKKTFIQLAGIVDENGQPILRNGLNANGQFDRFLLGREVILSDAIPSLNSSNADDTTVAFVFNPQNYILNTNYQITVRKYIKEDSDDHVTKAVMLVDGKIVDKNSLVTLVTG